MTPLEQFLDELALAARAGAVVSIVLSKPRQRDAEPARIDIRPVQLKSGLHYQWCQRFDRQEFHENRLWEATLPEITQALAHDFLDCTLVTTTEELQFRQQKRGDQLRRQSRERLPIADTHNRAKQYLLPEGRPQPFLVALEVMTLDGRVRADKQKKFRQINRYLEFVDTIYPHLPSHGRLQVIDFGCGLSYLTFALYHFLQNLRGREVQLVGLDRNPQVIARARELAQRLGCTGLEFREGAIGDTAALAEAHLVVSLHACDTATDAALIWGVQHRAEVILAVPCCQHELAPQLTSPPLELITRHGILKERLAAFATDALRAAALDGAGYTTDIVEFIDLEHTAKNLLLRAIRRTAPQESRELAARVEFESLKQLLGVQSLSIDRLLQNEQ